MGFLACGCGAVLHSFLNGDVGPGGDGSNGAVWFLACCSLLGAAAYVFFAGRDGDEADDSAGGDIDASDSRGLCLNVREAASAGQAGGEKVTMIANDVEVLGLRRRTKDSEVANQQPRDFVTEDPVWDADWAKLEAQRPEDRPQVSPVEVFEMNDTPTWLARMEHRREQAQRSGKQKLVQKIDKEIAEVRKSLAQEARSPCKEAPCQEALPEGQAEQVRLKKNCGDDVYGMDWSALPEDQTNVPSAVTTA